MIRKQIKRWIYGSCPVLSGSFTYFGTRVYFPKNSWSFYAACEQGIFEADNVRLLRALVKANTWFLDVGANIGLMSLPILCHLPTVNVLAFEPSPNTVPWLERTIASSGFEDRWHLVKKAVGDTERTTEFYLADSSKSLFDGLRSTSRVGLVEKTMVEQTTIDNAWCAMGRPQVSCVKLDIEGGESAALKGALECLKACRPTLLVEWNHENLDAFSCPVDALLEFAQEHGYKVYSMPGLARIETTCELESHMAFSESFVLLPADGVA